MKIRATHLERVAALALLLGAFVGCESTGGSSNVSGGVYYGVGFYDPWYYGEYSYDGDIVVSPPDRPMTPEHPIARPPESSTRPTPMPSIPSAPRPMPSMPRGGGGRR
jgi:hypothetical protein